MDSRWLHWNWGVPDWRDATAYPCEMKPYEWRWQFIRRRPDYRADWLLAVERRRARGLATDWLDNPEFRASLPGADRRYGLGMGMQNPALPRPGLGLFDRTYGKEVTYASESSFARLERNNQVLILFDLTKPLADQLETAKRWLEVEQEGMTLRQPRMHVSKWPAYLRVIDARDAAMTWRTIADEVLNAHHRSEPAAARQVWDQARELMFSGWP